MIDEKEIGARIRKIRKQKRMTLQQLAERVNLSKGYLSKVEKSESAPPVSTLVTISKALGKRLSDILDESPQESLVSFVSKEDRTLVAKNASAFGYSYESIAYKYHHRNAEPYILTIPANPENRIIFQHDTEELLFVLNGEAKFTYGDREYIAHEGDCFYFDGSVPHIAESNRDSELVCLCIMIKKNGEGKIS